MINRNATRASLRDEQRFFVTCHRDGPLQIRESLNLLRDILVVDPLHRVRLAARHEQHFPASLDAERTSKISTDPSRSNRAVDAIKLPQWLRVRRTILRSEERTHERENRNECHW